MELLLLLPLLAAGAFLFDWGGDDDDDAVAASGEDIDLDELMGRGAGPPAEDEEPGEDDPEDEPEDELTYEELRELYAGDDTITGSDGDENERLRGYAGDDVIDGGRGEDRVQGDDGNDTVSGGRGFDYVSGGDGADSVLGNTGNDRVTGGPGNDTARGGEGDDTVQGGRGDDLATGGEGDDLILGDEGIDTLLGGPGNDRLLDATIAHYDGPNWSVMDGGPGDDTLFFEGGSLVTGGEGADSFQLEDVVFDDHVAQITDFDPAVDRLELRLDVDETSGGELSLETWEDGTGADLYYGDDLIAGIAGGQDLDLSAIDVSIELDEETDAVAFTAGDADDWITGNDENNVIDAGGGDDIVRATGNGADFVDGGDGSDSLTGSGGMLDAFDPDDEGPAGLEYLRTVETDTLIGGDGDDVLVSQDGAVLTGGAGADTFGIDHDATPEGVEPLPPTQVTDFDAGEDLIIVALTPDQAADDLSVAVWDDGQGADIAVDGIVIANVMGGQSLTPSDIRVVERSITATAL